MVWWVGSHDDIEAATAAATAALGPDTKGGHVADVQVTQRWAVPMQTAVAGVWAVPGFAGMEPPAGVSVADAIEWPD